MSTETNQEALVTPEGTNEGQVSTPQEDIVTVKKADYDKLNETLGSLKRELKDLRKPKEEAGSPSPDQTDLLQKTFLRAAGITAEEDIELAVSTSKKWGLAIDKLVDDEDFKEKLERSRTKRANEKATSDIKGSGQGKGEKESVDHWVSKGVPPTPDQVSDRKIRAEIVRKLTKTANSSGKTFYND